VIDKGGILALRNAWGILQEHKDPRIADPYYKILLEAFGERETDMDAAFEIFRGQADPAPCTRQSGTRPKPTWKSSGTSGNDGRER
jgi:hypothetical protein